MTPVQLGTLTTAWPLMPGHAIVVRPLRPDDGDLVIALGKALSPTSLYQRFLNGGIKQNSRLLSRLLDVDFSRNLALIATTMFADEEMPIGVARYARTDSDPQVAEIAITIADAWQGRGIGKRLLRTLVEHAATRDIRRLTGDVLASNPAMLVLARASGFSVSAHPDESHLRLISLDLPDRRTGIAHRDEEDDL